MTISIPSLVQSLEKELKDTKFKHQFALDALHHLEADIELLEQQIKDIERDIKRHIQEVDRTSLQAIKW